MLIAFVAGLHGQALEYFDLFATQTSRAIAVSLLKLLCFIILIVHWLGCAYFAIAYLDGFSNTTGHFTPTVSILDARLEQQYLIAFAWGMRAVTDVGGEGQSVVRGWMAG
jgi:cyclic nucleotide gated channel alpha 3